MSTTNLFIDKTQHPTKDQGIIDIGKNCSYCNQLDFLPFVCEFCKQTFCSNHRKIDQHDCVNRDMFDRSPTRSVSPPSGVSSKTLFPDREADKKRINERLHSQSPRPTTILEKSFRVGDAAKGNSSAFKKFQKFLTIQNTTKAGGVFKIFKSSSASKSNYAEIATLKKVAKGDAKISAADRIYVWVLYISNPEEKLDIQQNRKAVFINKNWVVGRSLDSIADALHITNKNNVVTAAEDKLNIFKLENDEPKVVATSAKSSFRNGDTLYLVRGSI
ncbi:uncharacterized protein SPAPADRAFT_48045 [Spathaspora passalidarum NRRL Y-27907]|uniref:AN1-type domain-containing protein n=1 Tax=Spathaspora passalidarum (strain NRRL Y-27907 / 11-Y1) TaxID=619300 RepID=G3AFJ9_SPAPN|nr:uncharacterized protein SPAPADRAFT_48045 [Spathaspora passalidarum NRRL Y-27907]EGW34989.1 hypothetical protein SPAPADRAFT_48045 [Spathaspora passalidarum NRRL Y-27907]